MLNKNKGRVSQTAVTVRCLLVLMLITCGVLLARAQTTESVVKPAAQEKPVAQTPAPVRTNYRGIAIGTPADEVKDKLGKPEVDDKDGFYYQISDNEFAQIRIDKDRKVRTIAVTYTAGNASTPSYADVFGDIPMAETRQDGSLYNMVRYLSAGYLVSYSRSSGPSPAVTVMMQEIK